MQVLLDLGGSQQLEIQDDDNKTALYLALQSQPNQLVLDQLLQAAAEHQLDLAVRMYLAIRDGDEDVVASYISAADPATFATISEWGENRFVVIDGKKTYIKDGFLSGKRVSDSGGLETYDKHSCDRATDGLNAMHVIARDCRNPVLVEQAILKAGPEILLTKDRKRKRIPMHYAASESTLEVVQILLKLNGLEQVRAMDDQQNQPIHLAARINSSAAVIQALVEVGGLESVEKRSERWHERNDIRNGVELPLHLAAQHNPSDAVKTALAQASPKVLEIRFEGKTPLDISSVHQCREMRVWSQVYGTYIGRYLLDPGPAIHFTETSKVLFATDKLPAPPPAWNVREGAKSVPLEEGTFTSVDGRFGRVRSVDPAIWGAWNGGRASGVVSSFDPDVTYEDARKEAGPVQELELRWLDDDVNSGDIDVSEIGTVVASMSDLVEDAEVRKRINRKVEKVCLKFMKRRNEFEAEILQRFKSGSHISPSALIRVVGWHTPAEHSFVEPVTGQSQEIECTSAADEYPYIIVMERAERSLHDACAKERIAGYKYDEIVNVSKCIISCIHVLHENGVVHGDIKERNVLRLPSADDKAAKWILCDLDASAQVGAPVGLKSSDAYSPPELAQSKYSTMAGVVKASTSFDVWSFGAMLFELCAGRTLFSQDMNNDTLVELSDRTRLCVWNTISDAQLAPVLKLARTTPEIVASAKDLIRWCLKGDPEQRPSVLQVKEHCFLNPEMGLPAKVNPMRYHCFMSHAQADASGTVGTLFFAYENLGLHNWIDMRQKQLTLEGMRQGVRDSSVFLLILSERVLGSWFCQQEILCAISEKKHIQLVVEEEPRFHPFDVAAWTAMRLAGSQRLTKNAAGKDVLVPDLICQMIDDHLPNAVTYRRRDFETESMMRELCQRTGLLLPQISSPVFPPDKQALRVFLIYNRSTGDTTASALRDAIKGVQFTEDPDDLATADRVLLVLTAGILKIGELDREYSKGSTPPIELLERAIQMDADSGHDRILALYSETAGWKFGCEEQCESSDNVQDCLNQHEAVAYREKDDFGRNRHEFPAMIDHLLVQLGAELG
jgi:serine/threonine protein kinase